MGIALPRSEIPYWMVRNSSLPVNQLPHRPVEAVLVALQGDEVLAGPAVHRGLGLVDHARRLQRRGVRQRDDALRVLEAGEEALGRRLARALGRLPDPGL